MDTDGYLDMDLLRFTTAGSVDDGKSTLIGRLLYDSKLIFEDQMEAVEQASERKGDEHLNLALLTDGLRSEREQGITIDVAYRYFATPKRKFIIADTPGHEQYTRNMVTGASTANLAIILIDARHGMTEQTCRHSFIASLLNTPHIVFCVNKMDLVDYKEETFESIKEEVGDFSSKLDVDDIRFIPISALHGDNVVNRSDKMPWYEGPTLMYTLENIHISGDYNQVDRRFPVQYVIRPQSKEHPDYRGYAGQVSGGIFREGDDVMVLPSGFTSRISAIDLNGEKVTEAFPPMSVTLRLEDDLDVSRGDMIVRENNAPRADQDLDIMLCWMSEQPMNPKAKYALKHTTKDARCVVKEVKYKIDINTLHQVETDDSLKMNEIARVSIRTTAPLLVDPYSRNRLTGSLILIDEATNNTVAAGMVL